MLEKTYTQKIDLNKSEFKDEQELKDYLYSLTLIYGSVMNEIENDIVEKDETNDENEDEEFDAFAEFESRYLPVFKAFCSDKKRVYGGRADSFGFPSQYDGIEKHTSFNVTLKNKNRAEVYFETNNDFEAEYLFVVLRKAGLWRIDSVKYRWYKNEKWDSKIL